MENKFAGSYRCTQNALKSDSDSSDSDSGGDVWKRKSRRKRVMSKSPIKPLDAEPSLSVDKNIPCTLKKRKLNTVWCNVLQEQTVADDLVQFGLKAKPVSFQDRSCESYDFTLSALDPRGKEESSAMEDDTLCSKDACDETKSVEDSNENSVERKRYWPKTVHESRDVVDKVAKRIIRVLNEPKHFIIYKVVQVLGSKKALELLKETEKIEDSGGMFVMDNSRRRTPGGTFFQLLKKDTSVSNKKKSLIFAEERKMFGKASKKHSHHSRRKRKKAKNCLESMDIVFEPTDSKDMEDTHEQNDSSDDGNGTGSNDNAVGSNNNNNNAVGSVDSNETGYDDCNGTGPNNCSSVVSNGGTITGFNDGNETHINDVECDTAVKEDSELEEGEITD